MIAVPVVSGVRVVTGVHVVAAAVVVSHAPVVTGVHVVAVVLVRAPIAASDAESDVGVLPSMPLVLCAHTATLYP